MYSRKLVPLVDGLDWAEFSDSVTDFVRFFLEFKLKLFELVLVLLKDSKPEIRFRNSSDAT